MSGVSRLIAHLAAVEEFADTVGVQAALELDGGGELAAGSVTLRVHDLSHHARDGVDVVAGVVAGGLTPFVPILATAASALGADLVLDSPACPTAVAGAEAATTLLAEWFGVSAVTITSAKPTPAAPATGRSTGQGLLFSRGLDSMAVLCAMRDAGEGPTHLVNMDWVDPPYAGDPQLEVRHATAAAAEGLGLPLLRVSTDARALLDPLVTWRQAHVPVLAGASLNLSGVIGAIGVSSTYGAGHPDPYWTHELVDPLWSSSAVAVQHRTDVSGTRVDKAGVVAGNADVLRWLKVCWQRPGEGNCGRCRKCLGAMSALWLVGAGDVLDELFDGPLSPEAVAATADGTPLPAPRNFELLAEMLDAVGRGGVTSPMVMGATTAERHFAAELASAWHQAIAVGVELAGDEVGR